MTSYLQSAMYWLPPFLVILSCAWILSSGNTRNTSDGSSENESMTLHVINKVKNGRYIAILALGIFIGYEIRNHQLVSNTRTYLGVAVLSQQSDRRYSVRIPGYSRSYDWEFCHPLKMPSSLVDIKYEQQYGCKTVNGVGFVSIHNEEKNNAAIQTGRDPATATEAAARLETRR